MKDVVRSAGDGEQAKYSDAAVVVRPESEEPMTRQSEADQADINKILERFAKSGIVPIVERPGEFLDVSEIGDFRQALEQVSIAREYFGRLPADVRLRFDNDPAALLDAVNDAARHDELVKLGILEKGEPPAGSEPRAGSEGPPAGGAPPAA